MLGACTADRPSGVLPVGQLSTNHCRASGWHPLLAGAGEHLRAPLAAVFRRITTEYWEHCVQRPLLLTRRLAVRAPSSLVVRGSF